MITTAEKKKSGIYRICSVKRPSRFYIGSAKCIYARMNCHLSQLRKQIHTNSKLQRHYNKYGAGDLIFSVIEFCEPCDLISREQLYLDKLFPFFNIARMAGNTLGVKHTEKTKKLLSKIRKGWKVSLGRRFSRATKDKMSATAKARGIHPNFLAASMAANTGRKQTKELRDKIAILQRKITPEQARIIIQKRIDGQYQKDIAKEFGVSQRLIVRVEKRIGIYGGPDYFEAGNKRFNQHKAQLKLF